LAQLANYDAYYACVLKLIDDANDGRAHLSSACQKVYDDMAAPSSGAPSGTMCVGGTCCDSTGCY
jgi:hypothetical protein